MYKGGWTGKILWIDITRKKYRVWAYPTSMALNYIGGRGFAIRILWDHLKPGVDPLSPDNLLIFAVGPLTGLPIPSSGKLVVASKSPLTGGYGDGNIGTKASVQLKKAGYDAVVIEGKADKPTYLYIEDDKIEFYDARDLWGLDASEVDDELIKRHGRASGILTIGKAGENLVRVAVVMSEKDRAGGRPGMGAVMGSKNLKAIVIRGSNPLPVYNSEEIKKLGKEAYREIKESPLYDHWMKEGTMGVLEWCQETSVLPTYNFREGWFEGADKITGKVMAEEYKYMQKGCPNCNMVCGNMARAKDSEFSGTTAEIDYENVGMLGSNLGIDNFNGIIKLIREADNYGVDTISIGSIMAFATEAYKKNMIRESDLNGIKLDWGDVHAYLDLMELIIERKGFGKVLSMGTRYASLKLGEEARKFSMEVKGLAISAYDCHIAHGMALAFATCPIGAHHKDAWFIAEEVRMGIDVNTREKVEKIIRLQRIRGGMFETFVTCRLPWIEVGLNIEYYPKFMHYTTGINYTMDKLFEVADRIYNLIRLFWIREYGYWVRDMDMPPARWFEEPLTQGPMKGRHLDYNTYNMLLDWYYEIRGWDRNGIPRKTTLSRYGLEKEARELEAMGITLPT
ncbi:MAG TPA: aldehyde ferredoxin oxidoreductase [Thermoprotei archaeon]|nr:aldehyde ferredoxin oxidoreductase [Thermoprotei archaeon]